jgi:branched-chain amino acid transport system permease protein
MTHVQALIDALGQGAVFAVIAVGIGLVFGVLRLINFAYGQLIMLAAYMLIFTQSWPSALAVLVAVAVAVVAALVIERVAFTPLRSASPATMLVATFAISYLLQNVALIRASIDNKPFETSSTLAGLNTTATIGSLQVRWISIVAIVTAVVALGTLALLLDRTSIGLQMRAAAVDFRAARLLGVRADTVIMAAVAVSGLLAGVAAVILSIQSPTISNTTGLNETILVLVGVVVGGIDRLISAALGGFVIGFVNSFVGFELLFNGSRSDTAVPFTSSSYLPSVIYLLVIGVLLVRPAGLFARRGQGAAERV